MATQPAAIRFAYVLFNASILIAAAIGVMAIWWEELGTKLLGKMIMTDLIIFGGCTFVLAGYRTITMSREKAP